MRNKESACLRANWIRHARGEVLEVGIGSGLNLPYYSSQVQRVYGVDPSLELQQMARRRVRAGSLEVEFLSQSAEEPLPLAMVRRRLVLSRPIRHCGAQTMV